MFACHTPPFRPRCRRFANREWRFGMGPCGPAFGHRRHMHGVPIRRLSDTLFFLEASENDLEDIGSEYCFRRAVPGIDVTQLQVVVEGPILTVRTLTEVPGQRFEWRLVIPNDVSNECITAEVENGFLDVRLPKYAPRVIPVSTTHPVPETLWKLENRLDEYRLTHPAIGIHPEDVFVEVEEGFLFVKVQSPNGAFSREVGIPPEVDIAAVKIDIENEMLIITLPKLQRDEIHTPCAEDSNGTLVFHAGGSNETHVPRAEGSSLPRSSTPVSEDALYDEVRQQD